MTDLTTIQASVRKAREAFSLWKLQSLPERIHYASELRKIIVKNLDRIVAAIIESTGKVEMEALNSDILPTLEIMKYYEKHARQILKPQKRKTPFIFYRNSSYLEYKPLGVILVIAPWNYPFQLALVPVISALIAGNSVILKPSELTPGVGTLIDGLCKEAGFPPDVVQVIPGDKTTGEYLIQSGPDKIFFTGSVANGKKIMEAAAQKMIPVVLELGGKDPMIVFDDADLDRAVEAAVYGAFANSGQLCVSVERVYAHASLYDEFAARVAARAQRLRVGQGPHFDMGPLATDSQVMTMEKQVDDALSKGAKLLTPLNKNGRLLYPIVLKDVNHDMLVMQEETFGPIMPIMPFKTEEEAIALANDSGYGLNASVWSRDTQKAKRVVHQLETGNAYINDVVKNIGNPVLPFGGVKQSGFGKYHGPEGLYTFSVETSVMVNRSTMRRELNWFPYTRESANTTKSLIRLLYERIPLSEKIRIFLSMRGVMKNLNQKN